MGNFDERSCVLWCIYLWESLSLCRAGGSWDNGARWLSWRQWSHPPRGSVGGRVRLEGEEKKNFHISLFLSLFWKFEVVPHLSEKQPCTMATGSPRQTTTKPCVSVLQKYSSGNLFWNYPKIELSCGILLSPQNKNVKGNCDLFISQFRTFFPHNCKFRLTSHNSGKNVKLKIYSEF